MTPSPVVEHLDVVKDIGPCHIPGFVDAFADALFFQAAEERIHDGIVPTITSSAHAWKQSMRLAESLEVIAPVLAALIGM